MRRALTIVVVGALIALAGCGGSSRSASTASNEQKIERATQNEATAQDLHRQLAAALSLHHYAGLDDVYDLPNGGTCDIDGIYVGDQAHLYANDPNALVSPDGTAVVQIGFFQGTPTSECLSAAKDALGW